MEDVLSDILSRAEDLDNIIHGRKFKYQSALSMPDDVRQIYEQEAIMILPELIAEIKQQAAYVTRLETAFLEADERATHWEYRYTGVHTTPERLREKARESLGRIERGEHG